MKTITKNTQILIATLLIYLLINTAHASTDLSITSDKSTYAQGEAAEFKIIFTIDDEGGYCGIEDINLTFSNGETTLCALQTTGSIPSTMTACGFTVNANQTGCGSYGENGNQINYSITGAIPSSWSVDSYTAEVEALYTGSVHTESTGFAVTASSTTTTIRRKKSGGGGGGSGSGGITYQKKESCFDGLRNQNETGVDCGGPCKPCLSCSDGIQNQGEEGVDCGGPCKPCKASTTTTIKTTTTTTAVTTTSTTVTTTTKPKIAKIEEVKKPAATTTTTPSPEATPLNVKLGVIAAIGVILLIVIYRTTINK